MIKVDIGNYRGDLHIKNEGGKYYWAVECDLYDDSEWKWKEISKGLFEALALQKVEDEQGL